MPHALQHLIERSAVDPVFFSRTFLDVHPTNKQARWLRSHARESHNCTGRRGGKSYTEAIKSLHRGIFGGPDRFLNTARTYNQAKIIPEEAVGLCARTELGKPLITAIDRSPFYKTVLASGTEWWARSLQNGGDNVRGEWYGKVHNDEAGFGSKRDRQVLLPTLIDTRGKYSTSTTPNGLNFYFHDYTKAEHRMEQEQRRRGVVDLDAPGYSVELLDHLTVRWSSLENPWNTPEAIEDLKAGLSPEQIEQEIFAEFTDVHGTLCTQRDLDPIEDGGIRDDDLEITADTTYVAGAVNVGGCDLGRWQSFTVMVILRIDVKPWRVVKILAIRRQPWEFIQHELEAVVENYRARVLFDTTKGSVGDVIFEYLNVPGDRFEFTGPSKDQLLLRLKLAIQRRQFVIPFNEELVRQLTMYGTDPVADRHETWDYVMALALAVWQAEQNPLGAGTVATSSRSSIIPGLTRGGRISRIVPIRRGTRGLARAA